MFALSKFRGNPADQPKTFSKQSTLPRLPIPALEDTFARYIKSLEPILRQAEEFGTLENRQTAASELQQRQKWAEEAVQEGSLVRKLQQRLIGESLSTACLRFPLLTRPCPSSPPRRGPDDAQQLAR